MKKSNTPRTGFAGEGMNMSAMFKRWSHIFMKPEKPTPQYDVMPDFAEMFRQQELGKTVTRQNMSDIYGQVGSGMTTCILTPQLVKQYLLINSRIGGVSKKEFIKRIPKDVLLVKPGK